MVRLSKSSNKTKQTFQQLRKSTLDKNAKVEYNCIIRSTRSSEYVHILNKL